MKSLTWSTNVVTPQSLWFVRKPDFWGIKPGCANIISFTYTPSSGFIWAGVHIDLLFFTCVRQGRKCAWPNWQGTQSVVLFLHSRNILGKNLFSLSVIGYGNVCGIFDDANSLTFVEEATKCVVLIKVVLLEVRDLSQPHFYSLVDFLEYSKKSGWSSRL